MMKDMIPGFELIQPASVEGALNLLEEYGETGWALAGGMDSLGSVSYTHLTLPTKA